MSRCGSHRMENRLIDYGEKSYLALGIIFIDMFIRFDMIHERDRQTDRQTDTA